MSYVKRDDGEIMGRFLTREEFVRLDPGKVYDDVTNGRCNGVYGFFYRAKGGKVGIEEEYGAFVE